MRAYRIAAAPGKIFYSNGQPTEDKCVLSVSFRDDGFRLAQEIPG
jgi:hypothetical protein